MTTYVLDARTVSDHFPGIGRYVSNLSRAMAPLLDPTERLVLLVGDGPQSRWPLPAEEQGVKPVPVTATPFSLAQQWAIPALLKEFKASVYHSPYYLMPYRLSVPAVLTVYDLIPELFPAYVSFRARIMFRLMTRLALRAVERVITVSEATRRDLLKHYSIDEHQVQTIHAAADSNLAPAAELEVAQLRARLGLPARYVLYLGINKPHKNLGRLLRAWELAEARMDRDSGAALVIAGAWDERHDFLRDSDSPASVRFLGPVAEADLAALYSGAQLFVFPSLYEGFGLPVLEAMACGTAVTCSNRASLPEIAGDAALFFDPEDVEAIVAAISRLMQDDELRRELQERGRRRAASFSWEQTAQETLACYRTLRE